MTPLQVIRGLRWLGQLSDDQIVRAIKGGGLMPVDPSYSDLSSADVDRLRQQARDMTKSRLRGWREGRERQPTWLEVRALLSGLHDILT